MLKDNDLNEIGKRLYELEADPPKDGWNKIAGTIPKPAGKGVLLKPHWWKGLFLIVPLAIYLAWPEVTPAKIETALLKKEAPMEKKVIPQQPEIQSDETSLVERKGLVGNTARAATEHHSGESRDATAQDRNPKRVDSERAGPNGDSTDEIAEDPGAGTVDNTLMVVAKHQAPEEALSVKEQNEDTTVTKPRQTEKQGNQFPITLEADKDANEPSEKSSAQNTNEAGEKTETTLSTLNAGADTTALANGDSDANGGELISATTLEQSTAPDDNRAAITNLNKEEILNAQISRGGPEKQQKTSGPDETRPASADSTSVSENELETQDTTAVATSQKEEEEKNTRPWRMTATLSPSFTFKSVQPRPGDEVLVTSINRKKSSIPQTIGYGVSVGLGREVRSNIFIDAQIAFQTNTEQFSYSYTTGAVDTLIAQKQQDGSVSITPVYTITSAQIKTKLNYGGARIGATYYFWNKPKRRFNVAATGGANFLLSSDVRMNVNGKWVATENSALNKSTFSFMLSAGYSYRFTGSWELMISPNITYFTGRGNGYQQLSNTNQRSQGVNIMVSKFF